MTDDQVRLLKESVDKHVEIETTFGERLIAKVQIVTDDSELNVHDVMYIVVSSNMIHEYTDPKNLNGYLLDFVEIASVKAVQDRQL